MKRKLYFFVLLVMPVCALAQVTIQHPDVANLNRYIDFPVDKSTGTTSIDISIYVISANDFKLPVSLSYHTGGIKVNTMAGCAGLGWAINAGGIISRTIRSFPDEGGYFSSQGFTVSMPFISPNFILGDSEPDMFSFNVNGFSGKFFFDKNRQVHLVPEQDISITMAGTNGYTAFGKFILKTPDGTQYVFEGVYDTFELYDILGTPPFDPSLVPSAWHLTKIITPSQEEITFSYLEDVYETRANAKDAVTASANTGF